ncbi:MAG TPA: 23S rRNA (guanosine(2251)-2'-O)-methyltransferase RlmB [Acidimicrobiia bacterium]|nr:23S rRNA (guanosine(2251)-2'-O)-methyltransferase RlmB [Acidimicrobiia bacterium]
MSPRRGGDLGASIVPGRRAVIELLRAQRRRVLSVAIARGRDSAAVLDEIEQLAAHTGAPVQLVDAERLRKDAGIETAQGVLARAAPINPTPLADLLGAPDAFLVALDGVTDPRNLGAVLRTALGAGATGVIVPRHRSAPLSPAAVKAAAGAVEHLPIAAVGGVAAALEHASRAAVWTVGLDADAEADIRDIGVADRPLVLVLGAEGSGLPRLVRSRCDVLARIPMRGPIESLNVAAAAAVACFEVARHRRH